MAENKKTPDTDPGKSNADIAESLKQAAGTSDAGAINQAEIKSQVSNEGRTESAAINDAGNLKSEPIPQPTGNTDADIKALLDHPEFPTDGLPLPDGHANASKEELNEFLEFRKMKAEQAAQAELAAKNLQEQAKNKVVDHELYLQLFGPGYITAKRAGQDGKDMISVFSAVTWGLMKGNSNTVGWRQVIETPPEVLAMQNRK